MEIENVFTPRSKDINQKMYVSRPHLENALRNALKDGRNILVYGESGNGKTWLCKQVLTSDGINYVYINLSSAKIKKSITQEIFNTVRPSNYVKQIEYSESKSANISVEGNAIFAKAKGEGSIEHTDKYEIYPTDELLSAYSMLSNKSSGKSFIILDNLEAIFQNEDMMDELANLILLLDDDRYANYKVYFLIIGTPNGVLQYFRETTNSESVSNRIIELERVGSLSLEQVEYIIKKGFNLLSINIDDKDFSELIHHIFNITLGVAQYVQEYGKYISEIIINHDKVYNYNLLKDADKTWLNGRMANSYRIVSDRLNSRDTELGRRNQVLYCLGKIDKHQFSTGDMLELVKKEFGGKINASGISQVLGSLTNGQSPLLNKNNKNNLYHIRDSTYIMCIRTVLEKSEDGKKIIVRFA